MTAMTEAKVENRPEQPYVGIRTQVPWTEFETIIPQYIDEVSAWLGQQGIAPAGAPLMRYHVINMNSTLDVEIGLPVSSPVAGNGRINASSLRAGRYASLIYTGNNNGFAGNKALLDWVSEKGLTLDAEDGDGFGSRVEFFLTNPDDEPNPDNWETEVAMRLAES